VRLSKEKLILRFTFFNKGKQENFHGHVTALSVAPEFRRIGVSSQLMVLLENVSEQ
jgi:N-terminal acetyltransferase B complex catalytic subunit